MNAFGNGVAAMDSQLKTNVDGNSRSPNCSSQRDYPFWICWDCGKRYGRRDCGIAATWHMGSCGVCCQVKDVTEPRDFGHLKDDWKHHDTE